MSAHLFVLALALGLDRVFGDPDRLWRRLPHPVVLFGRAIAALDQRWNRDGDGARRRRALGVLAILLLLAGAVLLGWTIHSALRALGVPGLIAEAVIASIFIAQKSLALHVRAVAEALAVGLSEGRRAVSMIVGRDPEQLDEAGVARAAIESLAENASDGIVAPALAFLLAGLPGLFAYKMLNTADSMIGHLSERHRDFGWAAARLDDLANLAPARLTAALFAALSARPMRAWRAALDDGPRHRSPNAGWPEGAMAGALGLSLGGPRRYGDLVVEAPMLNAGARREARIADVTDALALLRRLCNALLASSAAALGLGLLG